MSCNLLDFSKATSFSNSKILSKIFLRILSCFKGNTLCYLFNLSAFLRKKNIRFSYDRNSKCYKARSSQLVRKFYSPTQNIYSYYNGFQSRADELAQAYFLDLIAFVPGDVIVDCGANVGDLQLYFHFKDFDVKYIAIEPSPLEFEALSCNLLGGKAINAGLFDKESYLDFFVSSEFADSSFIMPNKYSHVKSIRTCRLDSLIHKPIKLLKLEAEGAEPEVLIGALKCLNDIDYISADLGFERGIASDSTLPAVSNYLISQGFRMIAVGKSRLTVLFVRSELV